jgi:hypothetical protein
MLMPSVAPIAVDAKALLANSERLIDGSHAQSHPVIPIAGNAYDKRMPSNFPPARNYRHSSRCSEHLQ